MKTCSCFGHRDILITSELEISVKSIIVNLIENEKVSIFYFGGFGDFDALCHRIVSELMGKYCDIKRIFCLSDERHLRLSKRPKFLSDTDYEEFIYLPLKYDYWYTRIYYRNLEIMDASDFIIFYVINNENSGAYKCYKYAIKNKLNIIKL